MAAFLVQSAGQILSSQLSTILATQVLVGGIKMNWILENGWVGGGRSQRKKGAVIFHGKGILDKHFVSFLMCKHGLNWPISFHPGARIERGKRTEMEKISTIADKLNGGGGGEAKTVNGKYLPAI